MYGDFAIVYTHDTCIPISNNAVQKVRYEAKYCCLCFNRVLFSYFPSKNCKRFSIFTFKQTFHCNDLNSAKDSLPFRLQSESRLNKDGNKNKNKHVNANSGINVMFIIT